MHKTTLHYSERLLREAVVSFVIRSFIRRLGAIFFSLSPSSLESSFIFSPNTIAVGSLAFSLLPSYLPLYSSPPFSLPITAILLAVSDRCVHRRRHWPTTNRSSPWPRSLAVPRCLGQPSLRCGATHATGSLYSRPRSLLPCRLTASTRTRKISLVVRPQRQWTEANGGAAIIYAAAAAESGTRHAGGIPSRCLSSAPMDAIACCWAFPSDCWQFARLGTSSGRFQRNRCINRALTMIAAARLF